MTTQVSFRYLKELAFAAYHKGADVEKEIESLLKTSVEEISFIDDQFIVGKQRILKIAKYLSKTDLEYGIFVASGLLPCFS